jgi:hypothetical protein
LEDVGIEGNDIDRIFCKPDDREKDSDYKPEDKDTPTETRKL